MVLVHHALRSAGLLTWLAVAACIPVGADNLSAGDATDGTMASSPTSDGMSTQQEESASVTSAPTTAGSLTDPDTEAMTTVLTVTSTTAVTTSSAATTEEPMTGTCGEDCGTTTTTTTSDDTTTCGSGDCGESTASGETTSTADLPPGTFRRVFVTSEVHPGNFAGANPPFMEADALCMTEASDAMLDGTFKAWISAEGMGPISRFDDGFTGEYVLCGGNPDTVAQGWGGLVSGGLKHPIDVDANGVPVGTGKPVWTGTHPNGTPATTCGDWKVTTGQATTGLLDQTTGSWTEATLSDCDMPRRLYCIEDPT